MAGRYVLAALSLCLAGSLEAQVTGDFVRVTRSSAPVRTDADSLSNVVAVAHRGDVFELESSFGEWLEVRMFGGETRFLSRSDVAFAVMAPALPGSEAVRRTAFVAIVRAQDRAVAEAVRRYPYRLEVQSRYEHELYDTYTLPILRRYGIAPARYEPLILEGVQKNWIPRFRLP